MFGKLYPYEYVKSVFEIDWERLFESGFRGIIFDIDNTLVFQDEDATPEAEKLFSSLSKLGFKTVILSNNTEERVKRFLKNIDSPYVSGAYKPFKGGYKKALEKLGVSKEKTVFVGDQLFTDILGANRAGISNILVSYIRPKEETRPQFRRKIEKAVLCSYEKRTELQNRLGGISKK